MDYVNVREPRRKLIRLDAPPVGANLVCRSCEASLRKGRGCYQDTADGRLHHVTCVTNWVNRTFWTEDHSGIKRIKDEYGTLEVI